MANVTELNKKPNDMDLSGTAYCSGGTLAVTGTAPFAAMIQLAGHSNTILIH